MDHIHPDSLVLAAFPFANLIFALAMMAGSWLLQGLMMQPVKPPEKSTLEDFDFPQIDEGTPQSVIFGDVWIEDWQVLWYGNLRTSDIESEGAKK
jgi:hypothetical protein